MSYPDLKVKIEPDNLIRAISRINERIGDMFSRSFERAKALVSKIRPKGEGGVGDALGGIASGALGKNVTGMASTLTKVAIPIFFIGTAMRMVLDVLKKVSPLLGKMFDLFGVMVMMILKPIGDIIGFFLKPILVAILKMVIIPFYRYIYPAVMNFSKWWDTVFTGWVKDVQDFFSGNIDAAEFFGKQFDKFVAGAFDFGVWWTENWYKLIKGAIDFTNWWNTVITDFITQHPFDIGKWLTQAFTKIVIGQFNIGAWFNNNLSSFIRGAFDVGIWILNTLADIVSGKFDFGAWLKENLVKFLVGAIDFGAWVEQFLEGLLVGMDTTGIFDAFFAFNDSLANVFKSIIDGLIGVYNWFSDRIREYTFGIVSMPKLPVLSLSDLTKTVQTTTTNINTLNTAVQTATSGITSVAKTLSYNISTGAIVPSKVMPQVYQGGGYVWGTGYYKLERGESIFSPKDMADLKSMVAGRVGGTITVNINVAKVTGEADWDKIGRMIERKLYDITTRGGRFG